MRDPAKEWKKKSKGFLEKKKIEQLIQFEKDLKFIFKKKI